MKVELNVTSNWCEVFRCAWWVMLQ